MKRLWQSMKQGPKFPWVFLALAVVWAALGEFGASVLCSVLSAVWTVAWWAGHREGERKTERWHTYRTCTSR